jgi:fido (protein-threonine AMPylation protein)
LPLNPGIQTLDQYDQATLFGALDALAYLRTIEPASALTVADIQQVHYLVFQGVHPWAGQFRSMGQMATIAGFPAADPDRIVRELELALVQTRELLETGRAGGDPQLMLAALGFMHVRFERVHPFLDGNVRSGRAILAVQVEEVFGTLPQLTDQPGYREAMRAPAGRDLAPLLNYLGASVGLPNVAGVGVHLLRSVPGFLRKLRKVRRSTRTLLGLGRCPEFADRSLEKQFAWDTPEGAKTIP